MDPTKPIKSLITFLTICGLWPNHKKYYVLYMIYAVIFQTLFTFSNAAFKCIDLFFLSDMNLILKGLFVFLSEAALLAKVINFHFYIVEMQQFIVDIKEFKLLNKCEEKLVDERLLLFTRILKFFSTVAFLSIFFSCISPMFSSEAVLPYPARYPIDWRNNVLNYCILYVYQVIGIVSEAYSIILMESYATFLIVIIGAHLDVLAMRFESIGYLNKSTNSNTNISFFVDCVQIYSKISKIQNSIEKSFSIPFFIQFIISGAIMCLTVFQIVTIDPAEDIANLIFYISYCTTILTEIFLPCYFGTELMLKNSNLRTAVYSSNWMIFPVHFQKMIVLFMEGLKPQRFLISGKLFSLSLNNFLLVMNRTYSLFAVLQSFVK